MKLYVARHGETEWNRLNKVCGRTDSPLTDKGLQQAQLLAERLDSCSIDVIIASPLSRAQETAGRWRRESICLSSRMRGL